MINITRIYLVFGNTTILFPRILKVFSHVFTTFLRRRFRRGLQHDDGSDTSSFREVLLAAVTKCSPSLLGQEKHYHTIFDVTWELLAFVRDVLEEDEKLSQVLTLTGTQINAQASTCERYIREFWPDLGPRLLSFIENTFNQCLRQSSFPEVLMITQLPITGSTSVEVEIKVNTEKTVIDVYGPLECQIQVTEILAWLTAAVHSPAEQNLSTREASLTTETYESDPTVACFKLQPKPLNPIKDGHQMCWHPLFVYSVIAVQFPYAQRSQGFGLEVSAFVMVTMAGILTAVEFRGGLVMRGLSTRLIPLEETEGRDGIRWRLATANTIPDAFHPELYDGIDE